MLDVSFQTWGGSVKRCEMALKTQQWFWPSSAERTSVVDFRHTVCYCTIPYDKISYGERSHDTYRLIKISHDKMSYDKISYDKKYHTIKYRPILYEWRAIYKTVALINYPIIIALRYKRYQ